MRRPLTCTARDSLSDGLELVMSLGASAGKLTLYHDEKAICTVEAGQVVSAQSIEGTACGVEVLVAGRKGFASGNRLDHLPKLIEAAICLARHGSAVHFDDYPPPGRIPDIRSYSEDIPNLSLEHIAENCQYLDELISAHDPQLWTRCSAERSESESLLLTTSGVSHSTRSTKWRLGAYVKKTEQAGTLTAHEDRQWCRFHTLVSPRAIADAIIEELARPQVLTQAPQGCVQALLSPRVFGWMISPILANVSGRSIAENTSPLAGKLGKRVLHHSLTIIDNPHRHYDCKSRALDSSGLATKKQTIFHKGVLQRFLYDLDAAGLVGATPTGNDLCSAYSPVILPGANPSAELLSQIDDGLYICDLLGFGQGNTQTGDFSSNLALAWRVQSGNIVGRVSNVMISGNVYRIFNEGLKLSSDCDYEDRYPHALVQAIEVSA